MLLFSVSMNDSSFSENPWRRRVESEPSAVSNWEKIPAVVLPTSSFTLLLYSLHLLSLFWLPPPLSDMMNPLNCVLYLQAGVIFKLFQLFHTFHLPTSVLPQRFSAVFWIHSIISCVLCSHGLFFPPHFPLINPTETLLILSCLSYSLFPRLFISWKSLRLHLVKRL